MKTLFNFIYAIIDWTSKNKDVVFVLKVWIVCTLLYMLFKTLIA